MLFCRRCDDLARFPIDLVFLLPLADADGASGQGADREWGAANATIKMAQPILTEIFCIRVIASLLVYFISFIPKMI